LLCAAGQVGAIKRKTQNTNMKIPSVCKIEATVSSDDTRYPLRNCYLDKEAGQIVATDGRCMAVIPCEIGEHDESGFVTPEALAMARKLAGKRGDVDIACNGSLAIANGPTFQRPSIDGANGLGTFPNYRGVIPSEPGSVEICVDVALLRRVCDAIGTTSVTLRFTPEVKGKSAEDKGTPPSVIEVIPSGKSPSPKAIGLVMPMRLS